MKSRCRLFSLVVISFALNAYSEPKKDFADSAKNPGQMVAIQRGIHVCHLDLEEQCNGTIDGHEQKNKIGQPVAYNYCYGKDLFSEGKMKPIGFLMHSQNGLLQKRYETTYKGTKVNVVVELKSNGSNGVRVNFWTNPLRYKYYGDNKNSPSVHVFHLKMLDKALTDWSEENAVLNHTNIFFVPDGPFEPAKQHTPRARRDSDSLPEPGERRLFSEFDRGKKQTK